MIAFYFYSLGAEYHMDFSLVVMSGKPEGKEIPVRVPRFIIGRDPDCQLRPASPLISKKHCAFVLNGDTVIVEDYGSTNGTFVNDEPVDGSRALAHGDRVKVGPLEFQAKLLLDDKPASTTETVIDQKSSIAETKASQPKKAPVSVASSKAKQSEEDIASMLFNFADAPGGSGDPNGIPEGSTIQGMVLSPDMLEELNNAKKPDEKKVEKPKVSEQQSTSNAAKAILDKMLKRPR